MRRLLGEWLALAALWLVLAATLSRWDVLAAAGVAGLVVAFATMVRRRQPMEVAIHVRWLVNLVRVPVTVAHDLGILARRLRHPRAAGAFRALPFDVRGDDAEAVGRRALLTAAASLGPNTYVLGWDLDRQLVLVHQLDRSPSVLPVAGGDFP